MKAKKKIKALKKDLKKVSKKLVNKKVRLKFEKEIYHNTIDELSVQVQDLMDKDGAYLDLLHAYYIFSNKIEKENEGKEVSENLKTLFAFNTDARQVYQDEWEAYQKDMGFDTAEGETEEDPDGTEGNASLDESPVSPN